MRLPGLCGGSKGCAYDLGLGGVINDTLIGMNKIKYVRAVWHGLVRWSCFVGEGKLARHNELSRNEGLLCGACACVGWMQ